MVFHPIKHLFMAAANFYIVPHYTALKEKYCVLKYDVFSASKIPLGKTYSQYLSRSYISLKMLYYFSLIDLATKRSN